MNQETIKQIRAKYPKRITRGKAIRLYCRKICCANDEKSWKKCSFEDCFLYNFRLGKELGENPRIKTENDTPSGRFEEPELN